MNILNAFTRKSLGYNKTRTLVTIIGIILSMALFTAVIEGAYSGQQFLIRTEEDRVGPYMVRFPDISDEDAERVAADGDVEKSAILRTAGWAEIGSENEYKPYLLIKSMSGEFTDLVSVRLKTGRMPENEGEILLPSHLSSNGKVLYKEGDMLTLKVGSRVSGGVEQGEYDYFNYEAGEEIVNASEKSYTVVGTYERFDGTVENYGCPGYTVLTKGDASGRADLFVTVKHPLKAELFADKFGIDYFTHADLLRFYGSFGNANIMAVLYGFAAVLVVLISFGSISLIYNSFSISVSERTRQFGILKSVGATKKQIRGSVIYEALLLSGIGIPVGLTVGCTGIGITLYLLRDAFSAFVVGGDTQMRLVLNPVALSVAVVVCLVTTLISAWIPARKAMSVPAVDAIRQTEDIRIRAKEVRTWKLTEKLFGFEGAMASKNFKRNKKRYRATVISLFLSVVLFISASSFCAYLTDSVRGINSSDSGADITYYTMGNDMLDPEDTLALLSGAKDITRSIYYAHTYVDFWIDGDKLDESIRRSSGSEAGDNRRVGMTGYLVFVQDEAFRKLCSDSRIDDGAFFDKSSPKAVIRNRVTETEYDENGNRRWVTYSCIDEKALPVTVKAREQDDGAEFVIAESVEESIFSIPDNAFVMIYPYSMRMAVMGTDDPDSLPYETVFSFAVKNHKQAFADMQKLLEDSGFDVTRLYDQAADKEAVRMLILVVNVFAYGFIILISLIAIANVFNTISTNISLRRREFATLKSIGLGNTGFRKMMNYECIIYGIKGLMWGLPASIAMTFVIYKITSSAYDTRFYIPWYSVAIAVGSVFLVVFATMLYATGKIRKDNLIDALKNENL